MNPVMHITKQIFVLMEKGNDMDGTFYKPLTPDMRKQINESISKSISELKTCEPNAFVNVEICGYQALRGLFNSLPDGYPIPLKK